MKGPSKKNSTTGTWRASIARAGADAEQVLMAKSAKMAEVVKIHIVWRHETVRGLCLQMYYGGISIAEMENGFDG